MPSIHSATEFFMRRPVARVLFGMTFALGLTAACAETAGPTAVHIRIHNISTVSFDSTIVNFSNQTEQYGALPAGTTSEYRQVSRAYSYAFVRVVAAGKQHTLQPVDYVGEKPLKGGSYTYEIGFFENTGQLTQRMVRD